MKVERNQLPCSYGNLFKKPLEYFEYRSWQILSPRFPFESQIVAGAFNRQKQVLCRDQLPRGFDLVNRSEGIARAVHEHHRYFDLGQVLRARLVGPTGCVQRVRQQKQAVRQFRLLSDQLLCDQHACLAAAVALSAKEKTTREKLPHRGHRVLQPLAIASGIPRSRRTEIALLAKWQIAAQYRETRTSKGFRHRDKYARSRVAAGTVRED